MLINVFNELVDYIIEPFVYLFEVGDYFFNFVEVSYDLDDHV